ncbi:class I adenylate-forming enzyme family protein [Pseudonocardia lutea]|jgi:acyl-CoA synthetase (AMP-forming)/AMP-acid ligase II|uniref:Class I adenylate-forming enzyme family protein n=1 Tax=Pseudonocardia lutea TaxID=2172015 RepID=A0ABW1IDB0_9PSEU
MRATDSDDQAVASRTGSLGAGAGVHADDTPLGRELARMTAPGAEFALREEVVGGIPMRVYERGPHTLAETIADTAAFGDRPYWVYADEHLDYATHLRLVHGLAAALRGGYGLEPGDRVAIAMRNYPEWGVVFWAAQLAGLVAVPLNAWWTGPELVWAVGDSGARVVVADGERAPLLAGHGGIGSDVPLIRVRGEGPSPGREWADLVASLDLTVGPPPVTVRPDDPSTILYTSGTTGRPKGAVHTHRNHVTNALNVLLTARANAAASPSGRPAPPQSGTLLTYPLFHIAGLNGLYGQVVVGGKVATLYRWDREEARRLVREERLTGGAGVPTTMRELAEIAIAHPDELASLSRIGMGGAPIPGELVQRIGTELGPLSANGYGLTETTSAVCANIGADYVAHPDSVGRPAPGADLRIVDPETLAEVPEGEIGELWFRGPNVVGGYWHNPGATAAAFVDGWFRTGDLGFVRAGWVYVVDRLKDVVLRGGENVYSAQVEAALHEVPWVAEVAVFGVPHPTLGEEVAAAVRTEPGTAHDDAAAEALRAHVTARVAGFAAPAHVFWWDEPLPRTATGKLLKRELRERSG